jgi:hypothetical protein
MALAMGGAERHRPPARRIRPDHQETALAEGKQSALVLEKESLHVEPTAEADERTVGADHAMARQDDRKRVAAVRGATARAASLPSPSRRACWP